MTNAEILKKSIEKAVEDGWGMFGFEGKLASWNINEQEFSYQPWLYGRVDDRMIWQLKVSLNDIIFSHDFAKAFWGSKPRMCTLCGDPDEGIAYCICGNEDLFIYYWQHHQHKMLDEVQEGRNPLKYLEKFLEEK